MGIPKIIHYCWFGDKEMSKMEIDCINSWKKYCPDYQFILWNEKNYDYHKNRYMEEAALAGKWSFVTDYVRLDVLYDYGGFYFDTDVELIKSIDELCDLNSFIGFEQKNRVNDGQGIGSVPQNGLINEMLAMYDELSFYNEDGSFNLKECPQYRTLCLLKHGLQLNGKMQMIENMVIFPKEFFCPKDFETGRIKITTNTFGIHHFRGSWHTTNELRGLHKVQAVKRIFGVKLGGIIIKVYFLIKHAIFHRD